MNVRLIKLKKLNELFGQIEYNLENYRTGNFDYLRNDSANYIEILHEVDNLNFSKIQCTEIDHKEVENCIMLYDFMHNLSRYHARDERLWVYLVHTDLLDYSRKRWPIPENDELAIKHIRTHFFVNGARGFERDNTVARLWWMAFLCNRVQGIPIQDVLTCLLYKSDVRANIIERPTTSLNKNLFNSVIKKLHTSYIGDKSLFERDKFRSLMKEINLLGGVKLLSSLEEKAMYQIVEECVANKP